MIELLSPLGGKARRLQGVPQGLQVPPDPGGTLAEGAEAEEVGRLGHDRSWGRNGRGKRMRMGSGPQGAILSLPSPPRRHPGQGPQAATFALPTPRERSSVSRPFSTALASPKTMAVWGISNRALLMPAYPAPRLRLTTNTWRA